MKLIDPPGIIREIEDLAQLAKKINAEHRAGLKAMCNSLPHYRRCGLWLAKAKKQVGHGQWLAWLNDNIEFNQRHARRYIEFSKSDAASDLAEQLETWYEICRGHEKEGNPKVSFNTGENEWYTPPEYLEAARTVLGTIDLDPASSTTAQKLVRAATYYTKKDDGLSQEWAGKVWMNPPYASELIGKFAEKLCSHFAKNDVPEAITLVNDAMETQWAQLLSQHSSAICFPLSRVKFLDSDGNPFGAPLQGQAAFYLGSNTNLFLSEFSRFGSCWRK